MLASKPDPLSMESPVILIRSRIRDKRLFEARFLYRQLDDAIGEREKAALERELAGLIQQVDTLQQQARNLLAEGQREQAARLYREMEAIAVDVPGLAEEKRALEGAAALAAKIASRAVEPAPEPSPQLITPAVAAPVEDGRDDSLPTPPEQGKKRVGRLWLAVGLAGLALLLLLLLIWRGATKDPVPVVPPAPPAHNILIRPLVSDAPPATEQPSPAMVEQPPVQKAEPGQPPPPAEQPAASTRPLTLGTLQIQESGKK